MKKFLLVLAIVAALAIPQAALADEFIGAVASNFEGPAKQIAAEFEKDTGHTATLSFGSTGSFATQIRNGSPVAIFLAADSSTPQKLEEEGFTKPGTRFTYAQGALVLWSATDGYVDAEGQVLKTGDYKHLAVANPELAPYGAAAYELLKAWDLLTKLQGEDRLVTGDNIGQTVQFVQTGNAELGLVAQSQVWKDGKFNSGSGWVVSPDLYSPILQDAVILKAGADNAAAQAFADYLKGDKAKEIILSFGYKLD
ncbi:MAG: molybdate ABC transporter substrate-binding protein [Deltaproteobacteria bacterium]|jgi:molybdate transport system substrate-binding protein|nr:molybdate ABC transporter substrate-binding protein [Deltaproteobacteria bacterium]